ncbi:MAG: CRISPR-associated protein Cas4 [Bacillus thermozeamaize]|uniref:CRISPR-associated exonuclease Cas4 n=1 Tax=Bacillus thermozeamaize TaxID=230954 RepID=A0A1Y3PLC5_9BACI|nr:MAG: CRISPR-associated protein Cas4 [Bacillus thermozeamaize]
MSEQEALGVNGTLIWYYYICKRQVWLMARQLNPDEHDENLEWGRFLHEWRYAREKKELAFENVRLDVVGEREGKLVVAEVKKSSKFRKSAEMQLLFYLWQLWEAGVEAVGELRFPEEKRRETVRLDESSLEELKSAVSGIHRIVSSATPPKAQKIGYCKNCAYREFCWA